MRSVVCKLKLFGWRWCSANGLTLQGTLAARCALRTRSASSRITSARVRSHRTQSTPAPGPLLEEAAGPPATCPRPAVSEEPEGDDWGWYL